MFIINTIKNCIKSNNNDLNDINDNVKVKNDSSLCDKCKLFSIDEKFNPLPILFVLIIILSAHTVQKNKQ